MYVKIHNDKKHNNKGSSQYLVSYLEKENLEKEDIINHQCFFNQEKNHISAFTVQDSIDSNRAKLCSNESKFYMISINPSGFEQKHICRAITGRNVNSINDLTTNELKQFESALKSYSRLVMDEYAKNFNRGLTGDDLMYFGKVEHQRSYSRDCKEVRDGLNNIGEVKEGLQSHIHIIVSRKDITNKIKLSPMAKAKNAKNKINGKEAQIGFDRMKFVNTCEKRFDTLFKYNRSEYLTFMHYHTMKNQMGYTAKYISLKFAKTIPVVSELSKVATLSLALNNQDPLKAHMLAFKLAPFSSDCLKAISYIKNPAKLMLDISSKVVTEALNIGSI